MSKPKYGQLGLSASAQPLLTGAVDCVAFVIKAPASNTQPAYIGDSAVTTANGFQLDPGDEFEYERLSQAGQPLYTLNVSDFYGVGTTPDKLTWLASP